MRLMRWIRDGQEGAGVLGDEAEIVIAFLDEVFDFGGDAFERARMQFALEGGDGAERTGLIAPFGEFDIGVVGRAGDDALRPVDKVDLFAETALFCRQQFVDFVIVPDAGEDVDFAELFAQLLLVAFAETAGHDQNRILLARRVEVDNGIERFCLGRIDEAAGVDNDDVGFFAVGCQFVRFEPSHHHFGIDQVFRASQRNDVQFFVTHFLPVVKGTGFFAAPSIIIMEL